MTIKSLLLIFASIFSLLAANAEAQVSHCGGLTSIREFTAPAYPPIARAAHVQGNVIFMLEFDLAGNVTTLKPISGPEMLVPLAATSLQNMKVNPYTGSRTCPFVVTFSLVSDGQRVDELPVLQDLQHATITALSFSTFDLGPDLKRRIWYRWW